LALRRVHQAIPGLQNYGTRIFVVCFILRHENAPGSLQMEFINLKCDTDLNQKFSETNLQDSYSYLPIGMFPVLRSFGLRITVMFGSTYMCKQSFYLLTIIIRKADLISQMDTEHLS
jgi:17beta-estradiol 17-dehydrogenase/3beta-hydroxysteroid 3-dehydrogenase/mitotic-spindle organizing protein 1